ncbi:hypothetical protein DSECCO2_212800 [anaerobic digester metagenome]
MKSDSFFLSKKIRPTLSRLNRIYKITYGLIVITGCIIFASQLEQPMHHKDYFFISGMAIIGFTFILYGLIGKKILADKIQIYIDNKKISIKKTLGVNISIPIGSITYIKFQPASIELSFIDYSKTYDLSILNEDEVKRMKEFLINYCSKHDITVE